MITKVVIKDNKNAPLHYLSDLSAFKNGKEYEFKSGVNIIVGKNGCGKTTLMKLIEKYCLVDKDECSTGAYNGNISGLFALYGVNGFDAFYDGVDVYADYARNIFRLCHANERQGEQVMEDFDTFTKFFTQIKSSTGEGVIVSLNSMFKRMFSEEANLTFDFDKVGERYPEYGEYIKTHRIPNELDEITLLMDEPDRNLDIENIDQIKNILSFHKKHTQIIAVVHNPLLICALSKVPNVNFIEMTRGYVNKIKKLVKELIK